MKPKKHGKQIGQRPRGFLTCVASCSVGLTPEGAEVTDRWREIIGVVGRFRDHCGSGYIT